MELRHLRYFIALAGSLNFTRAAERVHVTQSTLSHQIRQLEEELGEPLFDRLGKRVQLTEAGEAFLAYAGRALQEIDLGVGELKTRSVSMSGVVRIGTTHTFNLDLIPDCVGRFLGRHPTVKVVVEELHADAIAARLSGGELDLGIAYKPASPNDLRFEPLFNEQLVLVVAADHPLASRKRIRMIELHHERLILLPGSFSTRQLIDECLAAAGAQPNVIAEMNTNAAMLSVVGQVRAGTVVAANAVPAESRLVSIALESPTPIRTPGLLFSASRPAGRTVKAFAALVRRAATRGRAISVSASDGSG